MLKMHKGLKNAKKYQIFWKILKNNWEIFCKCWANITQILCKYWANIVEVLGKYWLILGQKKVFDLILTELVKTLLLKKLQPQMGHI